MPPTTESGEGRGYRGGRGTPMVLLHGLGATWRVWAPVLPALTSSHEVLALTLPGHLGRAPLASPAVTPRSLTDAVEADIDREGFDRVHVVGNSLGGWLALELARRGRAASVTAIAPVGLLTAAETSRLCGRLRTQQALAARTRRFGHALARFGWGRAALFAAAMHRPSALTTDEARQWLAAFAGCPAFGAIVDGLAAEAPDPLPADLGVPTSIVWPVHDRVAPADPFAARFEAALPRALHTRVPGAGHIPMRDAPECLAELILGHARSAVDVRGPA